MHRPGLVIDDDPIVPETGARGERFSVLTGRAAVVMRIVRLSGSHHVLWATFALGSVRRRRQSGLQQAALPVKSGASDA